MIAIESRTRQEVVSTAGSTSLSQVVPSLYIVNQAQTKQAAIRSVSSTKNLNALFFWLAISFSSSN